MGVLGRIRGAIRSRFQKTQKAVRGDSPATSNVIREKHPVPRDSSDRDQASRHLRRIRKVINLQATARIHVKEAQPVHHGTPTGERYVFIRDLGAGANGEVALCRDTKMGTLVAVKTIRHVDTALPTEVQILQILGRHENIVQCYNTLISTHTSYNAHIIFEYCPIGDLWDYTNKLTEPTIAETFIWHLFKHVASGLHFMHRQGVIHGDVKCANILLTTPFHGEQFPLPKIADFGTASLSPLRSIPQGHLGTHGYQAPEWETYHGPEADIWALGTILHELAHGTAPRRSIQHPQAPAMLWFRLNGKQIPPNTIAELHYQEMCYYTAFNVPHPTRINRPCRNGLITYSKLLNYFMMRCLDFDPDFRISAMELVQLLPTLETLVYNVLLSGQEHLINDFDDGHDKNWKVVKNVRDSGVLKATFCALATRSSEALYPEAMEWGGHLLPLMEPLDRTAACHYARYPRERA